MDLTRRAITQPEEWDAGVQSLPDAHILQSWVWGEFKSEYGWRPTRLAWHAGGRVLAAAQVLERPWPSGGWPLARVLYVPRGPILDWSMRDLAAAVRRDLQIMAKERRAIFIKIDPEIPLLVSNPAEDPPVAQEAGETVRDELHSEGWIASADQVQFRSTFRLDLRIEEDALLARMKPKTRYNVRLAERRGVSIRPAAENDFDDLYAMYAETSVRDGFVIRPKAYYREAWGRPWRAGRAQPFLAEVEGRAVAGLILFHFGSTAWYFYGMSRSAERERMPTHLLQWEAIRWAKRRGLKTYDFWGAPDSSDPEDAMFGVYRFKAGFGAAHVQTLGAWDQPLRPAWYRLYAVLLPRVLGLLRARQRRRTQLFVDEVVGGPGPAVGGPD